MTPDLQLNMAVAVVAVLSWGAFLWANRPHSRGIVVFVLALGMFSVSWLASVGTQDVLGFEVSALLMATVNRAFVASVGLALATQAIVRRWESRRRRAPRET